MEPTREHLRRSHTDESLQSHSSDAYEAIGIVLAIIFIVAVRMVPLEWAWPLAVVGAICAIVSIASWFKRKLDGLSKWRL